MVVKLTKEEKRFLREMRKMEREQVAFGYRRIADRLGYTSVGTAWQFREQLERKGYLSPGLRLAEVACPVVTETGLELLGERKAA